MRLIAIGRMRDGPEAALFARYNTRLRPALQMQELPEARGSAAEVKRRESEAVLAALPDRALVIALDQGGIAPDSIGLAALLDRWRQSGRPLTFLIGGAEGLDATALGRADASLSLGKLTWPHMLVRALLAEQLYRAQMITTGHPYHRAGRPE